MLNESEKLKSFSGWSRSESSLLIALIEEIRVKVYEKCSSFLIQWGKICGMVS